LDKNATDNEFDLGVEIHSIQVNWRDGNFLEAGRSYGAFWSILIGAPDLSA